LRIAIIGPVYPFRGGIAHYTSHLAYYLKNAGHEVMVFSFRRQYPTWLYPGESDQDPSQTPLQCDAEYLLDPIRPWTWRRCANAIKRYKPDLIVLTWWVTFWGPAFSFLLNLIKREKIPITILIHNVLPHEAKPWDRYLTKMTLQKGDRYIVQTEDQKKRLLEIIPDAETRVSLCPHPIYNLFPNQRMKKRDAMETLGIPAGERVILAFGIVRAYKGIHPLLDALSILDKKGMAPTLLVVGEFWDPVDDYRKQINELGLQNKVTIIPGYQPDEKLPLYFSAADLLVAPYTGGTQSGVVKLALGFGLPVLVTNIISDKILAKYEGRGVTTCPSAQPDLLAEYIEKAFSLPWEGFGEENTARETWQDLVDTISQKE
jgi:glycosyltransferase involved in cell wall biosynthesis